MDEDINEAAHEAQARRAAKRVGLVATKSRWRRNTIDNHGGFQILDPFRNWIVAGVRFDMTPQQVIEYCAIAGVHGWRIAEN
jgi:hypothetical protein